jgi:type II secretory pathway pseudopilin PulG
MYQNASPTLPSSFGSPTPPPRRPSPTRITLLLLIVALVIVAGIGLALFIPYQQAQIQKANATATAQAHATGIARDATGTVVADNTTATATARGATATVQANASATASVIAANPNPYPPNSGTLAVYDSLSDNNQGNSWNDSVDQSGVGCAFKNGAYHITSAKGYIHSCTINSYTDIAFEAHLMILKGDCGSLVFRNGNSGYYAFSVCQDGTYELDFYTNSQRNLVSNSSSAIKTGFNQPNVIAVVVRGTNIDMYVNNQHVGSAVDKSSNSGGIGFGANAFNNATEVAFTNMRLWTL